MQDQEEVGGKEEEHPTEELCHLFQEFDADGSGEISQEEFHLITRKMGLTLSPKEMNTLMLETDADHSGTITFDEFVFLVKRARGVIQEVISKLRGSYLDEQALAAGADECEWYTDTMILKRENLRSDPMVLAALESCWSKCSQGRDYLDQLDYREMLRKIYLLLKAQACEGDFSPADCLESEEEDWEADTGEKSRLKFHTIPCNALPPNRTHSTQPHPTPHHSIPAQPSQPHTTPLQPTQHFRREGPPGA